MNTTQTKMTEISPDAAKTKIREVGKKKERK